MKNKLEQIFDNNSDCYTYFETSTSVTEEKAMTRGKFIDVVSKLMRDITGNKKNDRCYRNDTVVCRFRNKYGECESMGDCLA